MQNTKQNKRENVKIEKVRIASTICKYLNLKLPNKV